MEKYGKYMSHFGRTVGLTFISIWPNWVVNTQLISSKPRGCPRLWPTYLQ